MLNPLNSKNVKKGPARWMKTKEQKAGGKFAPGFHLDQLARELAQEWDEMAMGWTDVTGGWQAS